MAATPATLQIDFTSNYTGGHRVCWTITGGPPYDCTTIVNCLGGATACQALIPIMVDSEQCGGPITFEGYIQAVCEDIASTVGRLPFNVDFTPDPTCDRYTITCVLAGVDTINVTNPGSTYNAGAPVVTITETGAPPTIPATATANLGTGFLIGAAITAAGTGYTLNEKICISDGAGGAGADLEITAIGGSGEIQAVVLNLPGDLYESPVADAENGTCGSLSTGTGAIIALTTDFQTVVSITVTAPGSEYDAVPDVTVAAPPGGGITATAVANMLDCAAFNPGNDCNGDSLAATPGLPFLEPWGVCIDDGTEQVLASEYSMVNEGCCTDDCIDYHIENTDPISSHNALVTECGTGDVITVTVAASLTVSVCAAQDGVHIQGNSELIVTDNGPCIP